MRLVYEDAKRFKIIIEQIGKILVEGHLLVDEHGLRVRGMDAARVAIVDVYLPQESFSAYEVEEAHTIGVTFADLVKWLKRANPKDSLEMFSVGKVLQLKLVGAYPREYTTQTLDLEYGPLENLRALSFDVGLKLKTVILKDWIQCAEVIQSWRDTIIFEVEGLQQQGIITVSAADELRTFESTIPVNEEGVSVVEYYGDNPPVGKYNRRYLKDLCCLQLAEEVTIRFARDAPMQLLYELEGGGTFIGILAPFVED